MKPTILVAVPSFINKLIDFANNNNISYKIPESNQSFALENPSEEKTLNSM
ncbi:MAG: hypothetical protein R2769_09850 [Saprospiraceae bacterium]